MKKMISSGLTFMMLLSTVVTPICAAETTDVIYTQGNNYTISIPKTVNLKQGEEVNTQIQATQMNVSPTEKVQVSVNSGLTNGQVILTHDNGTDQTTSKVSLTSNGTAINNNSVVASFESQDLNAKEGGTLYFAGLANNLKAGTWKGQMTFDIKVVNK